MPDGHDESGSPIRRVPTPTPPKHVSPQSQQDAENEQRELDRARSKHRRDQVTRHIVAGGMWTLIVLAFAWLASCVIVLGIHTLLHEDSHWLTDQQVLDLKNFVLSGAIVGLGTTYLRRYLDDS